MGLFDDVVGGTVAGEAGKSGKKGAPPKKGASKPGTFHGVPIWALALGGTAVAYLLYKHFKSSSNTSSTTPAATTGSGSGNGSGNGGPGSGLGGGNGGGPPGGWQPYGGNGNGGGGTTTTTGSTGVGVASPVPATTTMPAPLGGTTSSTSTAPSTSGNTASVAPVAVSPNVITQVAPALTNVSQTGPYPTTAVIPTNTGATTTVTNPATGVTGIVGGAGMGQGAAQVSTLPLNEQPGYVPIPAAVTATNVTAPAQFINSGTAANNAAGTAGTSPAAVASSTQNKAGAAPSGTGVVY